jgi:hypothetical protein
MAIRLMANAAESNIDMIADCPDDYISKPEIEAAFLHLNEQALDMFEDHIHDLRINLEKFLRNAKFRARVTRIDYNENPGAMTDITVKIDVE